MPKRNAVVLHLLVAVHAVGCGRATQSAQPFRAPDAAVVDMLPVAGAAVSAPMLQAGSAPPLPPVPNVVDAGFAAPVSASPVHVQPARPALPDKCLVGCAPAESPATRAVLAASVTPPPLGGSGLLVSRDGKLLVAADADRDRLYFVDLTTHALLHVRELQVGDQPGRLVEDANGRIHVVLRGGGALLSVGREADAALTRRPLCALPRGVAYDAAKDLLHVACAEGQLVTAPAAPSGEATRRVELGRDLRDVIVHGDELLVTRFRAAELLRVDANGKLQQTYKPPVSGQPAGQNFQTGQMTAAGTNAPNVVWRAIDVPGKGSALLHQRSRNEVVPLTQGGYGSTGCSGILQTSVTIGVESDRTASADLSDATLALDMAVDPSGTMLAVISPGNWTQGAQLQVYSISGASPLNPLSPGELPFRSLVSFPTSQVVTSGPAARGCLSPQTRFPAPDGQLSAVAWATGPWGLEIVALEREPAAISFIDVRSGVGVGRIDLGQASRYDTGHALFHMRTISGVACASCHAEAGDDGHVWSFENVGARRTQNLRGGISGSEPLHWDGDMRDFTMLFNEVMAKRMRGPMLSTEQGSALERFLDRQPKLSAPPSDPARAARGKALFESAAVGCASCHAGSLLTDNRSVDVGTGAVLQVPALRGVSFRLPLMHDGCASSLRQRFDATCGGGDAHGHTSALSASELDDLIAYLETL